MRRWRAFLAWLLYASKSCATCGRPRVGFSIYCRQHTDEILRRR